MIKLLLIFICYIFSIINAQIIYEFNTQNRFQKSPVDLELTERFEFRIDVQTIGEANNFDISFDNTTQDLGMNNAVFNPAFDNASDEGYAELGVSNVGNTTGNFTIWVKAVAPPEFGQVPDGYTTVFIEVSSECIEGYFLDSNNGDQCNYCPSGTYLNQINSPGPCLPCPAGSSTNGGRGKSECLACIPGTYAAKEGQSSCTICPRGTVSRSGSTECEGNVGSSPFPVGGLILGFILVAAIFIGMGLSLSYRPGPKGFTNIKS